MALVCHLSSGAPLEWPPRAGEGERRSASGVGVGVRIWNLVNGFTLAGRQRSIANFAVQVTVGVHVVIVVVLMQLAGSWLARALSNAEQRQEVLPAWKLRLAVMVAAVVRMADCLRSLATC